MIVCVLSVVYSSVHSCTYAVEVHTRVDLNLDTCRSIYDLLPTGYCCSGIQINVDIARLRFETLEVLLVKLIPIPYIDAWSIDINLECTH